MHMFSRSCCVQAKVRPHISKVHLKPGFQGSSSGRVKESNPKKRRTRTSQPKSFHDRWRTPLSVGHASQGSSMPVFQAAAAHRRSRKASLARTCKVWSPLLLLHSYCIFNYKLVLCYFPSFQKYKTLFCQQTGPQIWHCFGAAMLSFCKRWCSSRLRSIRSFAWYAIR